MGLAVRNSDCRLHHNAHPEAPTQLYPTGADYTKASDIQKERNYFSLPIVLLNILLIAIVGPSRDGKFDGLFIGNAPFNNDIVDISCVNVF